MDQLMCTITVNRKSHSQLELRIRDAEGHFHGMTVDRIGDVGWLELRALLDTLRRELVWSGFPF